MKKLLLCVAFAIGAFAQGTSTSPDIVPTWRTGGHMNGRFWGTLDANRKTVFVLAYADAIDQMALSMSENFDRYKAIKKPFWPGSLTGNEVVLALDKFYATPENSPIAISVAVGIVAERAFGADEATMQKAIANARSSAAK